METGNEQEIKIVAWINVVAVEVMRNSQHLNIFDFRANKIFWHIGYEFGRRRGVANVFLRTLVLAIGRWNCQHLSFGRPHIESYVLKKKII